MSNYFNLCPDCGANLDPGEKCGCSDEVKCFYYDGNTQSFTVELKSGETYNITKSEYFDYIGFNAGGLIEDELRSLIKRKKEELENGGS